MNKKTMIYGGGALALVIVFLYLRSRSSSAAAPSDTIGTPADQGASDYANLAGALQGAGAQEQSDIAGLNSQIAGLAGQETSDIAGVNSTIAGLGGANGATTAPPDSTSAPDILDGPTLAAVMAGQKGLAAELKALNNKVGVRNRQTASGHANNHHPAGTAGHAVGARSHAPKGRKPVGAALTTPSQHPAVHAPARKPKPPARKPKPKPPAKPARRRGP